jgi:hypothetical protein
LIMDIQHILQSESKLMFNNLKKSKWQKLSYFSWY